MSMTEKMLIAGGLARGVYSRWRLQRLLSGVIVVAGLTIITSMLIGTMLIGGFYAAYFAFLHYGMEPQAAILLTVGLFMVMTAVFVAVTVMYLHYLREMPRQLLKKSPMATRASEVVDAFLDGLMTEETH